MIRFKNNEIFGRFVALVFFLSVFLIIFFASRTMIRFYSLSRILVFCSFIFLVIPPRIYQRIISTRPSSYFILNIFATGPFITMMVLGLNFFISHGKEYETYQIDNIMVLENTGNFSDQFITGKTYIVNYKNNALEDFRRYRRFDTEQISLSTDSVRYTFKEGIFHMKVVKEIIFLE